MAKHITLESKKLTERIIELRDIHHMPWRSIAEQVSLSSPAVQERYAKARGVVSVETVLGENRKLRAGIRKVRALLEELDNA